MLSRPIKLFMGVTFLLIACAPVVALLMLDDDKRQQMLPGLVITFLLFGAPGLWALASGIRPALMEQEQQFVQMRFIPSALFIGLGACAAGATWLYLFYNVFHVSKAGFLFLGGAAVILGPIYSAMSWAESCLDCGARLHNSGVGQTEVQFCPDCANFLIAKGLPHRPVVTGREAIERIARIKTAEERALANL